MTSLTLQLFTREKYAFQSEVKVAAVASFPKDKAARV
jgi:hypothetical protein